MKSFHQFLNEASINLLYDDSSGLELSIKVQQGIRLLMKFHASAFGGSTRELAHDIYNMSIETKITKNVAEPQNAIAPPAENDPSVKAVIAGLQYALNKKDFSILIFSGPRKVWNAYRDAFQHVIPSLKPHRQLILARGPGYERIYIVKPEWMTRFQEWLAKFRSEVRTEL